jgi:hypothetical protein
MAVNMATSFRDFSYFIFTDIINMDRAVTGPLLQNSNV